MTKEIANETTLHQLEWELPETEYPDREELTCYAEIVGGEDGRCWFRLAAEDGGEVAAHYSVARMAEEYIAEWGYEAVEDGPLPASTFGAMFEVRRLGANRVPAGYGGESVRSGDPCIYCGCERVCWNTYPGEFTGLGDAWWADEARYHEPGCEWMQRRGTAHDALDP